MQIDQAPNRRRRGAGRRMALAAALLLPTLASVRVAAETVATVAGKAISRAELESMVEVQLRKMEIERHALLERALEAMIAERLVSHEATERGVDPSEMLEEAVGEVTVEDAEVDAWYQANSARIRQPKEAIAQQIRDYLREEKARSARQVLVDRLRAEHGVEVALEPLRFAVDSPDAPSKGPADAPVTVVEFSDFQCPACRRVAPIIDRVHAAYPDQVRVVFRHFPLRSIHPQAQLAAEAAVCAETLQDGAFWSMHDELFARQNALGRDQLVARAESLGLDRAGFVACLDERQAKSVVDTDYREGEQAGVGSTPSLFVNGRPVQLVGGVDPFKALSAVIDDELAQRADSMDGP